jgi:endo-1,4-beta-xylanase
MAAEKAGRLMGAALGTYHLDDVTYGAVAAAEFNYLTPENEMKWSITEPSPNDFKFEGGDALVAFAEANQMRVKGHCLVWYSQLPNWVKELDNPEAVRGAMSHHIQQVAGHFKGKLLAWDVVNEAIDDGNGNALRDSVFLQQLGPSYIDEAFRLAREADPSALLFYNDYGTEGLGGKSDAAYALVKRLVESGVPIDGVGLQMHIGVGYPSANEIEANIRRLGALGLVVNISELDVNLCGVAGDQAQKLEVQRQRYREVIAACLAVPQCDAITIWGVTDKYSWLNRFMPCSSAEEAPQGLPWDDAYARKPAWKGIVEALLGKGD